MDAECMISTAAYVLLCLDEDLSAATTDLARNFCGRVVRAHDHPWTGDDAAATVFVCGDLARCPSIPGAVAVEGLSFGEAAFPLSSVPVGCVPIRVHGVGVFFRSFFSGPAAPTAPTAASPGGLFGAVAAAHEFQDLTESNKGGVAFRRGVYLSDVVPQRAEEGGEPELAFHLLRCSSNLSGPTQGFEAVDRAILAAVNGAAQSVFGGGAAPINHVLAQVYLNTAAAGADAVPEGHSATRAPSHAASADGVAALDDAATTATPGDACCSDAADKPAAPTTGAPPLLPDEAAAASLEAAARSAALLTSGGKERKAAIKAHSDKTKDMPASGVLAFCSFYESFEGGAFRGKHARLHHPASDPFDFCVGESFGRGASALTSLHFQLKRDVHDASLAREFSVTLYPDSLLLIPLSSNRLYTHEIRPSLLPVAYIPTRLGYVARCSKTRALFSAAAGTRVVSACDSRLRALVPGSAADLRSLRSLYFAENTSSDVVRYGDAYGDVFFSMNGGDFLAPTPARS